MQATKHARVSSRRILPPAKPVNGHPTHPVSQVNGVVSTEMEIDEGPWTKCLVDYYQGAFVDVLTDILSKGSVTEEEAEANKASLVNVVQKIAHTKLDVGTIKGYASQLHIANKRFQHRLRMSLIMTMENIETVSDPYYLHIRRAVISDPKDRDNLRKFRPPLCPEFTGREDILMSLQRDHMGPPSFRSHYPNISVLSGMGGSGKTQIALKFASEYEKKNPSLPVYFVNARSKDSLVHSLNLITETQTNATKPEDIIAMLERRGGWCIIMDNADDETLDLKSLIPQNPFGHIIVTTRNSKHRLPSAKLHTIDAPLVEDVEHLLLDTAQYPLTDENRGLARAIGKELWFLPLAIVQAAVYIRKHRCLDEYLGKCQSYHKTVLSFPTLSDDTPRSVITAIQMSLDQLPEGSYRLLQLLSFFQNTAISHDMLCRSAKSGFQSRFIGEIYGILESETFSRNVGILKEIFCPSGEWTESGLLDIIQPCLDQSLLLATQAMASRQYSMHSVVQALLQSHTRSVQDIESASVQLLSSSVTKESRMDLTVAVAMMPHIQLYMSRGSAAADIEADLTFAMLARGCGNHQLALSLYQRAYEESIRVGDTEQQPHSPLSLKIQADIALSYFHLGQLRKSFSLQVEVYNLQAEVLGEEHQDPLWTLGNISTCLHDVGKLEDALSFLREAHSIQEKVNGAADEKTLWVLSELARVLFDLGRHEEALKLREQVLEELKKIRGEAHPTTVQALARVGSSLGAVEQHQRAVEILEKAVQLQSTSLGERHPKTLWTGWRLAHSLRKLGLYSEAHTLNMKVWEGRVETLGKTHSHTLASWASVATSLADLGLHESARALFEEAVRLQEPTLGEKHPLTIRTKEDLDRVRWRLERGKKPAGGLRRHKRVRREGNSNSVSSSIREPPS